MYNAAGHRIFGTETKALGDVKVTDADNGAFYDLNDRRLNDKNDAFVYV